MPTQSEIYQYLKLAVAFTSGENPKWPFQDKSSGWGKSAGDIFLGARLNDARNTYRKETGYKSGKLGPFETNIPPDHATGILRILERWLYSPGPRQHNLKNTGLTAEAINLAIQSINEDY
jgi:hypothetical protein